MHLASWLATLILILGTCIFSFAAEPELFVTNDEIRVQAKKTVEPLWQTGVGPGLPDEMRLLTDDRLLVGLRKYDRDFTNMDLTLLDTRTGQVVWRYERKKHRGKYSFLANDRGYLLYKITQKQKGKVGILALKQSSGKEVWFLPLKGHLVDLKVEASRGVLVATTQHKKGKITIRSINIESGQSLWERSWKSDQKNLWMLAPLIHNQTLFSPYQGLECLSLADGRPLWQRKDLKIAQVSPTMKVAGDRLILIDSTNSLQVLNPASGATLIKHGLDETVHFSAIISLGQFYILGQKSTGESSLVALSSDLEKILWQRAGLAVPLSNMLLQGDLIYYASGMMLFSFNIRTGESGPFSVVSLIGSKGPAGLRLRGDKIIYLGEYVISDVSLPDLKLGSYNGITPITNELSTKGLDKVIKRAKRKLSASQKQKVDTFSSRIADNQIALYRSQVRAANPGKYSNSDSISPPDFMLYQKMTASTWEASEAILKAYKESGLEHQLNEVTFLREIVVAQLAQATGKDYAYRPHSAGSFNGIKLVHLLTGKSVVQAFSPSYLEYGFWNLVDFDKGVVYHHGLGLNPDKYEKSEKFKTFTLKKERLFNSSIIAYPLDL